MAANIVPSERQINWHELEFIAFIHTTVNTSTDREWRDVKGDLLAEGA